jgi:mevalonate kinase
MPAISCFAPGKLILCGEHAVVYLQPAIAIPFLSLGTTTKVFAHPLAPKGEVIVTAAATQLHAELNTLPAVDPIRSTIELVMQFLSLTALPACEIHITSTLPIAAGLGSSASLSVSLIRGLSEFLGHPLATEQINAIAYEAEKFHHGNPSGVDNTVIAYAKPVYFIRGGAPEFISVAQPVHFLVANSGISASTSEAVAGVQSRRQAAPAEYDAYFNEIGRLTDAVRVDLAHADLVQAGQRLTENHRLLQKMQVSCPELDRLVEAALSAGAWGAKLSGGGLGGNMLALVPEEKTAAVETALYAAGASSCRPLTLPASKEE